MAQRSKPGPTPCTHSPDSAVMGAGGGGWGALTQPGVRGHEREAKTWERRRKREAESGQKECSRQSEEQSIVCSLGSRENSPPRNRVGLGGQSFGFGGRGVRGPF